MDKNSIPNNFEYEEISRSLNPKTYCIDVFFHIIRDDHGNLPYPNPANLTYAMKVVNNLLNKHHIFVNMIGYDYIDNALYINAPFSSHHKLLKEAKEKQAINIYILDVVNNKNGDGVYGGYTYHYADYIYVGINSLYTQTLAHELGHCFGLDHTFEIKYGIEDCEGYNCKKAGDRICDTPADYYLGDKKDQNGNMVPHYSGDITSFGYNPDKRNIMSYYKGKLDRFSPIQVAVMKHGIKTHFSSYSSKCVTPNLTPIDYLCNLRPETIEVRNLGSSKVKKWEVSSGINIIQQNDKSITIEAKARCNGYETIKAILDSDYTLVEKFWVGPPIVSEYANISGPSYLSCPDQGTYYAGVSKGGEEKWFWSGHFDHIVEAGNKLSVRAKYRGPASVGVRVTNPCGGEEYVCKKINISGNGPGVISLIFDLCHEDDDYIDDDFFFSPNPYYGGKVKINQKSAGLEKTLMAENDQLNILQEPIHVVIYSDNDYQEVFSKIYNTTNVEMDLSFLPSGHYICIITQKNKRTVKRFIKK